MNGDGAARAGGHDDLHRPFRSVRGRRVAAGVAVVQAVVFLVLAFVPVWGDLDFGWFDRMGFLVVAGAVGWVLSRFAFVAARPRADGLAVRNLLTRRDLEWAEIVGVRLADGDPWVTVDLADGDTLAVMAIQRADGEHGRAEARRLSTLVALHSRTERDD